MACGVWASLPCLPSCSSSSSASPCRPSSINALARAYEGLGRNPEAEDAFDWAAPRLPGLEGVARHAAFLARTGRRAQAQEQLDEIDKRLSRANPHFLKEGRAWRDFAADAIARA